MLVLSLESDGMNCYPVSTPTNKYNNWGPIRDLEVILQLPNDRAMLTAYKLSTEMSSPSHVVTGLAIDYIFLIKSDCNSSYNL